MNLRALIAARRGSLSNAGLAALTGGRIPDWRWDQLANLPSRNGDGTPWRPRAEIVEDIALGLAATPDEVRTAIREDDPIQAGSRDG